MARKRKSQYSVILTPNAANSAGSYNGYSGLKTNRKYAYTDPYMYVSSRVKKNGQMYLSQRKGVASETVLPDEFAEKVWSNSKIRQLEEAEEMRKNSEKNAKDLSQELTDIRAFVNDPLGYAFKKAKAHIDKEENWSMRDRVDSELYDFYGQFNKVKFKKNLQKNGIQLAENMANLASKSSEFAFDRYTTMQEDYITAQAISNVKTTLNMAKGLASSVIGGAKVGGWVGAIVGAADWGVNTYFNYQERMSKYHQSLNATNFQTQYDASRLGLVGSSGTEN